jgi:hypothetical protein
MCTFHQGVGPSKNVAPAVRLKAPVPTTTIRTLALAITRHFSTPKPEDATIRLFL